MSDKNVWDNFREALMDFPSKVFTFSEDGIDDAYQSDEHVNVIFLNYPSLSLISFRNEDFKNLFFLRLNIDELSFKNFCRYYGIEIHIFNSFYFIH